MAHTVEIKEIINGVQITDTLDGNVVEKLISYQAKPFLRTTNEDDADTYQILDKVGEIYNIPALATEFRIIDKNDSVYIPADGVELIEYLKMIRSFRADAENDESHIGTITTTSNSLTINLPGDNVNWAKIDGSFYEKYYPDTFNFTPVTTGQKILILYAKPDMQVFYLAQGVESTEAIEPTYSGLFVARILVNSEGADITEAITGFKLKANDGWANVFFGSATEEIQTLSVHHAGLRFRMISGFSGFKIGGFNFYRSEYLHDGVEVSFRNETAGPVEITTVEAAGNTIPIDPADAFIVAQKETVKFAYHAATGVFKAIKMGSSPDLSGYATTPQLDAETVNRALADNVLDGKITTEKNRNDTQDGLITANTNAVVDLYIGQAKITTTTSITTNTLSTTSNLKQNGRNVLIANGVNAINITCETTSETKFQAIYHKLGSANVTFVAGAGVTLIQIDGTAVMTGAAGLQTASLHRDGNVFYLQISNR